MPQLDEDKELATLLTGYKDMVGLLSVHKVARFNTQVCHMCSLLLQLDAFCYVCFVWTLQWKARNFKLFEKKKGTSFTIPTSNWKWYLYYCSYISVGFILFLCCKITVIYHNEASELIYNIFLLNYHNMIWLETSDLCPG